MLVAAVFVRHYQSLLWQFSQKGVAARMEQAMCSTSVGLIRPFRSMLHKLFGRRVVLRVQPVFVAFVCTQEHVFYLYYALEKRLDKHLVVAVVVEIGIRVK
jgi:hypothetical protein